MADEVFSHPLYFLPFFLSSFLYLLLERGQKGIIKKRERKWKLHFGIRFQNQRESSIHFFPPNGNICEKRNDKDFHNHYLHKKSLLLIAVEAMVFKEKSLSLVTC